MLWVSQVAGQKFGCLPVYASTFRKLLKNKKKIFWLKNRQLAMGAK